MNNRHHLQQAAPVTTRWIGKTGSISWFDSANWSNGVPHPRQHALFHTGGTETVSLTPPAGSGPAVASNLLVEGDRLRLQGGALDLTPPASSSGIEPLLIYVGNAGSLTIAANATLSGNGQVMVGSTGAGELTILGTLHDSSALIGKGGAAQVVVQGPSALWRSSDTIGGIALGGASGAALLIDGGGHVDAGPNSLTNESAIYIGDNFGNGQVDVMGAGSTLTEAFVYMGNGSSGTLNITNGAQVVDNNGLAGTGGDGTVVVSGAGSLWENRNLLQIGSQVPVSSSVTITNHGTVTYGANGMDIAGTLALDPTAVLLNTTPGDIVSAGGKIIALERPDGDNGTVTITGNLGLSYNVYDPFATETTYVSSEPNTVLDLSGQISALVQNATLQIGAGHVRLDNAANQFPMALLYGGTLELAATGAVGSAQVGFAEGSSPGATLLLDPGVTLANVISGFGVNDIFDLASVKYGPATKLQWTQGSGGGTLGVSDPTHTETLSLTGSYSQASFALASDHHGGTQVDFVPGH